MNLEINFFELEKQEFKLYVFVRRIGDSEKKLTVEDSKFTKFRHNNVSELYEVSMVSHEGFEQRIVSSTENPYLTLWYISQLIRSTIVYDRYESFERNKLKFYKKISTSVVGDQELIIQPEYIEADKKFGILVNFHFNKNLNSNDYIQVQKLSFSLTSNGKINGFQNKSIREFIENNFSKFIDPILEQIDKNIIKKWYNKNCSLLDNCFYSNGDIEKLSNLELIRNYPKKIRFADKKNFYFIFEDKNRDFARNVYKALIGSLYKDYFSGMKSFFNVDIDKSNVDFHLLNKVSFNDLVELEEKILKKDKDAFLIVCLRGREEKVSHQFYVGVKLLCLKYNCASQFLYSDKLSNENTLKFSISNVALQIFCKSNGIPWSITNRSDETNSLIIGIGTSHKKINDIKSIFHAFAMCTDSSGIFNSSMTLAHSENKEDYFRDIEKNLIELKKSTDLEGYGQVVFHLTNKISKSDIKKLSEIIRNVFMDQADIVILKVSKSSKYIGFSDRNDQVVKKGTCIKLSNSKFLLWSDGHCNENVYSKRPSKPIDIEILHNPKNIIVKNLLEDIFKLSSANWHGFKTNALPITLVYSKNIANFIHCTYENNLANQLKELPNLKTSSPWFL